MSGTPPFDWNNIEPGIRPHVKALRDLGYRTTSSCEHAMYIVVDMEPHDIDTLSRDLKRVGYQDFSIEYHVFEGLRPARYAVIKFLGSLAGAGKPFDYVLLKVEPESHPLYFVIQARIFPNDPRDYDIDSHFYNSHTCPINWTDDIVAVISGGDADPHGFATFVGRITPLSGIDENNADWPALFPQLESG